jgi:UDP-N-acetylglucosamine--N-acetylmuramyl-(pentapeptide) pyrophosphoryl-undecaprenol N-acetylglucosamine transferase
MSGPVVLAAGGTGGHLFPAEAVARELLKRGRAVHLFTDRRADSFAETLPGATLHRVSAGRFGGPVRTAYGLAELAFGMLQARRKLRRLAPEIVIGFGGYPSVPTMLAAAQLGLATMVHEQNAVLGRANRLLAPVVGRIATGFAATAGLRPGGHARAVYTGNPVRPAILALGERPYVPPRPGGRLELLIVGGSQGARILGDVVPRSLTALPEAMRAALRISQQVRAEDLDRVADHYRVYGIDAELAPFFTDVSSRLERAHLVISRAGASTVAELAAAGRPAVLIPYPHATDDHQAANARAFAGAGAGWILPQTMLSAELLTERLGALLADGVALWEAAERARQLGRRDAAQRIAALALASEVTALPEAPRERAA